MMMNGNGIANEGKLLATVGKIYLKLIASRENMSDCRENRSDC